ncbi:hypothetical protein ACFQPA_12745 [Halomarina halobia]|uniref:FecR protein domain-containing protein n=1 Tax=Halomarina halobia TaxID=3033386 RepID=A0ABD6A9V6_9EURY|nr:hypothetical protein [Halomarina sp. PSR21]
MTNPQPSRLARPARGQANLPALAVALLVLTTTTSLGLLVADGAFAGAGRDPAERRAAVALGERLVSAESPLTARPNVLRSRNLSALDAARLDEAFPVAKGRDVRLRVGGETVVQRGDPTGGTTVRRIVLVQRRQSVTLPATAGDAVTLPRRSPRATLLLRPPEGTTVRTVRANGRVVLHDPSGLEGRFDIALSRFETTRLRFEHDGPLPRGSARVAYYPARTTKAELVVTVDG